MILAASTMMETHPSGEIVPESKGIYWSYTCICQPFQQLFLFIRDMGCL